MCSIANSRSRAATAAVTQLSIPPLAKTTANCGLRPNCKGGDCGLGLWDCGFVVINQTPFTSGPQIYLCNCNCIRARAPDSRTHAARSLKSTSFQTGENNACGSR